MQILFWYVLEVWKKRFFFLILKSRGKKNKQTYLASWIQLIFKKYFPAWATIEEQVSSSMISSILLRKDSFKKRIFFATFLVYCIDERDHFYLKFNKNISPLFFLLFPSFPLQWNFIQKFVLRGYNWDAKHFSPLHFQHLLSIYSEFIGLLVLISLAKYFIHSLNFVTCCFT